MASLMALALSVPGSLLGAYTLPVDLRQWLPDEATHPLLGNPTVVWTLILLIYCFCRIGVAGLGSCCNPETTSTVINWWSRWYCCWWGCCGGLSGHAELMASAPAVAEDIPAGAPPIWPFLFITIACGA